MQLSRTGIPQTCNLSILSTPSSLCSFYVRVVFGRRQHVDLLLCCRFVSELLHQEELAHFITHTCLALQHMVQLQLQEALCCFCMSKKCLIIGHYNWHETFCFFAKCTVLSACIELINPLTPNPELYSSWEVVPISPKTSHLPHPSIVLLLLPKTSYSWH